MRTTIASLTLGAGMDSESLFGNFYFSRGLSGKRVTGDPVLRVESISMEGQEAGRPYRDTTVTTTTTQFFQHVYEHGVGVRAGIYDSDQNIRFGFGYDREWGGFSSKQATISATLEKHFSGSPHSIGLAVERYKKSGDYEIDLDGTRALLTWRYTFGQNMHSTPSGWRQIRTTRQVQMPASAPVLVARDDSTPMVHMRKEQRIVKTTASMASDSFFELGRSALTETARQELNRVAATLTSEEYAGNIRVAGHTCDLGSDSFNLRLSVRRAESVRDYLISKGVPANALLVDGQGESQPKYINDHAGRPKNRRVDVEFVQYRSITEEVEVPVKIEAKSPIDTPAIVWATEVLDQEPIWVRRALRSTAPHKQNVNTYRGADIAVGRETSRTWLNRVPVAGNDSFAAIAGVSTTFDVLANDSDPDGNSLRLVAVGSASNGSVAIDGSRVRYTGNTGYSGTDSFSYRIEDGAGGVATGTVTVSVTRPNQPPVAIDDRYVVGGFGQVNLPVLLNDSDPDGDSLVLVSFTQPTHGTISRQGSQLAYQGNGYFSTTSFAYTVSDGKGGTATAIVTLVDP